MSARGEVALYQKFIAMSVLLERELGNSWERLTEAAMQVLEKTHKVTRAILEENAFLETEGVTGSAAMQQGDLSHASLVRALQERIQKLKEEKKKLSDEIARLNQETSGLFDFMIYGGLERYRSLLKEFIGYAKQHTHSVLVMRANGWSGRVESSLPGK